MQICYRDNSHEMLSLIFSKKKNQQQQQKKKKNPRKLSAIIRDGTLRVKLFCQNRLLHVAISVILRLGNIRLSYCGDIVFITFTKNLSLSAIPTCSRQHSEKNIVFSLFVFFCFFFKEYKTQHIMQIVYIDN